MLNIANNDFGTSFLLETDGLCIDIAWVIYCADIRAGKAAALRAVLPIRKHWRWCARVDLNRHCLRCGRNHGGRRHVRLRSGGNQPLDRSNLLPVVEFLELDQLWLHVLNKSIAFCAFQLSQKFLCKSKLALEQDNG